MTETQRVTSPTSRVRPDRWLQHLVDSTPWHEKTLIFFLMLVGCFSLFFLLSTLTAPVLDQHAFRQAQTAINIYYAIHEGSVIAYQTPVLGSPWEAPFEGPVYQTIVAGLVALTGMSIDAAGRLVSYGFFLGTIWMVGLIIRMLLPRDRFALIVFATLMLASPLYLFWGRTVLIETCAIFFGAAWLYLALRATRKNDLILALFSIPICILAAFAKATSWPAFVVGLGIFWAFDWRRGFTPPFLTALTISAGILLALLASFWWIAFSDEIKSAGPLSRELTSTALTTWNYGTMESRFSARLWSDLLPRRMLQDLFGFGWLVVLIAFTHLNWRESYFWTALGAIVLFFVPLSLFTNLHLVHNYYQTANGLFLIAAAAIVISGLARKGHVRVAVGICVLVLIAQVIRFSEAYWPLVTANTRAQPYYQAAQFIRTASTRGTALITFGIDWNPMLHYYSERKGVAVPGWIPSAEIMRSIIADREMTGGLEIGSIIACSPLGFDNRPELKQVITEFIKDAEQRSLREERFADCTAIVLK